MKKIEKISPFFIIIYSLIFLFVNNLRHGLGYSFEYGYLPLLISLLFFCILFFLVIFILNKFFKNKNKIIISINAFLFMFFSYGHLHNIGEKSNIFLLRHRFLFPIIIILFLVLLFFIIKIKKDYSKLNGIIGITVLVLIILNIFSGSLFYFKTGKVENLNIDKEVDIQKIKKSFNKESSPDIYYIIADEMAHPDAAKEVVGFRDFKYINKLKKDGFYIADKSKTGYSATEWSIASSLNFQYVADSSDKISMIYDNKITYILKSIGYNIVHVAYDERRTKYLKYSDVYLRYYKTKKYLFAEDTYYDMLFKSTIMKVFYDYFFSKDSNAYEAVYMRNSNAFMIKKYFESVDISGPKFVFSHIQCPQFPYVFGKNGEKVDYIGDDGNKGGYLNQYIFWLKKIDEFSQYLIKNSKRPFLLIIQSDHGIRMFGGDYWKKIFNAYLAADKEFEKVLYDSISPINTFRVVLNYYFKADLDLLEDPVNPKWIE